MRLLNKRPQLRAGTVRCPGSCHDPPQEKITREPGWEFLWQNLRALWRNEKRRPWGKTGLKFGMTRKAPANEGVSPHSFDLG
jgi:hypothetical protein